MTTITYIILGVIIGGLIVWFWAKTRLQGIYTKEITDLQVSHLNQLTELEGRAKAAEALASDREQQITKKEIELNRLRSELDIEKDRKTRLEESQKNLQEQIRQLEDMEKRLKDTFQSLSLDVLAKNSDQFLNLADAKLEGKKELIDNSLKQMTETLSEVQKKISDVEKGSVEISTLVKHHADITSKLKDTTEHLRHALASSKKRGEWGERMAEDILRLVGMVEGLNYIKQKTLEESSNRPDYTFFLPNKLKINMDVKFPLDNYQHYLDAQSEHDRKRFKDELLKNAKSMIKQVTSRNYIDPSDNTVDYVIVFVPNEQVYSFINESDTTIMDEALKQKVILCSPFTLYAVLAVIRQAVENFNLEQTASEILKLLSEFSKQWNAYTEKFKAMGDRLDAAKKEYDALVTTRTNQLEKPLRKIEDLRKQKAIELDEKIKLDETALLS